MYLSVREVRRYCTSRRYFVPSTLGGEGALAKSTVPRHSAMSDSQVPFFFFAFLTLSRDLPDMKQTNDRERSET